MTYVCTIFMTYIRTYRLHPSVAGTWTSFSGLEPTAAGGRSARAVLPHGQDIYIFCNGHVRTVAPGTG